jgi:uncharacterized short protein YbdD (DUF466 family)
MTELLKDLFDLPLQVHKSDFVLELTSGVSNAERTASTYVVTAGIKDSLDRSLKLIASALSNGRSMATYLHGSFGSGKSHFMAVLSLLLDGNEAVWKLPELHSLRDKHDFVGKKKLLQLRYHMIGANSFEEKVLGEYVAYVRQNHPDAPIPGVFADEELFENAKKTLERVGDEKFFAEMGGAKKGLGKYGAGWNRERFDDAVASSDLKERQKLFDALTRSWFEAYVDSGRYVDIDTGLAVIARHARDLGFDGIVLYLDELILWLSHRASQQEWLHNEVQKMVKLVESQEASRAIPIVSFIARQRNLAEMVGEMHSGMENQLLHESLQHWEGRFDKINLEDRDLPAIVEKRVLKPRSAAAKQELNGAFERMHKEAGKSFHTLLGKEDLAAFQKLYPFSPALVSALVALSNSLQRERTAIKLLLEILVEHSSDLRLGELVRVGDLFDVLAGGEDPADGVMRARFNSAKELYKHQFLPVIQESNGTNSPERCQRLRDSHPIRLGCSGCGEKQCRIDNRIIKTLLIAALVPEVDELKELTVSRVYSLNHGMIKAMVPGGEVQTVRAKIQKWAASIAQVQLGNEKDPLVKIRLEGVDIKPILERYQMQDNAGARQRVVRDVLFEALGIEGTQDQQKPIKFMWRGSPREGSVHFGNVRALKPETLRCPDDHDFRLVVDYPFDEPGKTPADDIEAIEAFKSAGGSWTLVWLPHFFSAQINQLVGELAILNYILESKQIRQEAVQGQSLENQSRAIHDLESLRTQKRSRLLDALSQVYGLTTPTDADVDSGNRVDSTLHVLKPGAGYPRADLAANLSGARDAYISALLELRYPRHPEFSKPLTFARVNTLAESFASLVAAEGNRIPVEKETRGELNSALGPLGLIRFTETHAYLVEEIRLQPLENKRLQKGAERPQVSEVHQWIDESNTMGLQTPALDLVTRCYSVWSSRTFELDGKPIDAASPYYKNGLPDRAVLEKPELPSQTEWVDAFAKAGQCFGVSFAGKHLSPDNLGKLRTRLDEQATKVGTAVADVSGLLTKYASALGVDPECDRLTTARSAEQAIVAVRGKSGVEQVRALARYAPATSATAVGRHLSNLSQLQIVLKDEILLGVFTQLRTKTSELAGAEEVLEQIQSALRQDEIHVELASRLRELGRQAQQLLAGPIGPAPEERVIKTWKVKTEGRSEVNARLAELVRELEQELAQAEGEVELSGSLTLKEK